MFTCRLLQVMRVVLLTTLISLLISLTLTPQAPSGISKTVPMMTISVT